MMSELDRQVSLAFYQRLQKVVAVLEMKVFGSRARGDATFESDLDVFIKVDTIDRSVRKKIIDVAWEVGFEYDRVISTFIVTEQQLKTALRELLCK
ncbi:MAG: nucleotidyltransferase domain-containing protein [Microcystis aeruginosa K13-07]|nr:nucleotidyltransferase domain-containing protein [Microcystis aeruginosa K13-07]